MRSRWKTIAVSDFAPHVMKNILRTFKANTKDGIQVLVRVNVKRAKIGERTWKMRKPAEPRR
jgi:hypothetical protein